MSFISLITYGQTEEPLQPIAGEENATTTEEIVTTIQDEEPDQTDFSSREGSESPTSDPRIWKYPKFVKLGYTVGTLDQKKRFGGMISSRWGILFESGRNIYVHKKPIGGFLRFGINFGGSFSYMNFANGTTSFSDMLHPGSLDETMSVDLGRHFITAGISLGPTATFAPFASSNNSNLACLLFRPYFLVIPSYAAYLVSDSEEMEVHNSFAFWLASGLEIQWKHLIFGVGWKGCTATFKSMTDSIMNSITGDDDAPNEKYKFDTNMVNFSIGFTF